MCPIPLALMAIPITVITGFLGSGKTTLILNLIPQLPQDYKLALLKNEFGDLAIDSQLAESAAISGVQELLNGCICCNLVGQLKDALETLRKDVRPDRIIIETSGSALPTTLVLEINRIIRETGRYSLDGVISVIDVQNWTGYEDTSYTAKIQARYTDLIVFNKWELVDERRYDICLDRVGDLDTDKRPVKSDKGRIEVDVLFGVDNSLARKLEGESDADHHSHDHGSDAHSSEVEVLSCTVVRGDDSQQGCIDLDALLAFLKLAPKDEIYRIKAKLFLDQKPQSSSEEKTLVTQPKSPPEAYLLNWAFGRWTFTQARSGIMTTSDSTAVPALRMTIITARSESRRWKKKLEDGHFLKLTQNHLGGQVDIRQIS